MQKICLFFRGALLEKLVEIIEKYWLKPVSLLCVTIIMVPSYAWTVSTLNNWGIIALNTRGLVCTAVPFGIAWIVYAILCINKHRLPRASKNIIAVLFCIDAENDKLYENAKYKLVNNFNSLITSVGQQQFRALSVSKTRLSRFDLHRKDHILTVFKRTNCALLVHTRYTADDVNNAENFELRIDYSVRHPAFDESATSMLSHDISTLKAPIGKQKFVKAEAIDIFNFTTQTLICACQYILGVVSMLAGDNCKALELLSQSKQTAIADGSNLSGVIGMIDDKVYVASCKVATDYLVKFQNEKTIKSLYEVRRLLELSNSILPDAYFYNLNMAYVHITLEQNAEAAKDCVAKCKRIGENTDWMYSDAFLSAYLNHDPGVVLAKYRKALMNPYKSLSEILEYIEIVIENQPDRVTLHLATALVYEEIGDQKLMKHHLALFMEKFPKLDRRTKEKIKVKMSKTYCGVQCNKDCVCCTSLVA